MSDNATKIDARAGLTDREASLDYVLDLATIGAGADGSEVSNVLASALYKSLRTLDFSAVEILESATRIREFGELFSA